MSDELADHRDVARRHELAAENHDRVASFWDGQGDPERAEVQREMAKYERLGAELESRRAEPIDPDPADPDPPHSGMSAAQLVESQTRQGAKQLSRILMQLATTLERSADLAEDHARRAEKAGRSDEAAEERRAAKRAREAAQHARSQAEPWLKLSQQRDG